MTFILRSNRQRSSNDELRKKRHFRSFWKLKEWQIGKTWSETHNARAPVGDATIDQNSRIIVVVEGEQNTEKEDHHSDHHLHSLRAEIGQAFHSLWHNIHV